jgi:hypothetical protein
MQGDAANLLWIWNWKAAARDRGEWRKKLGRPWPKNLPKHHRRRRRSKLRKRSVSTLYAVLVIQVS